LKQRANARQELRRREGLDEVVVGTAVPPDHPIASSGKPISPNNVLRRWVFPACEALTLRRATWLTFRRTYSSWAHDKGVPGKIVAELMGHTNVDTTLNVYTQVLDACVRNAVAKVGDELFTIVHKTGGGVGADSLICSRRWLAILDEFRNWALTAA